MFGGQRIGKPTRMRSDSAESTFKYSYGVMPVDGAVSTRGLKGHFETQTALMQEYVHALGALYLGSEDYSCSSIKRARNPAGLGVGP